jgi:hypothetical protein
LIPERRLSQDLQWLYNAQWLKWKVPTSRTWPEQIVIKLTLTSSDVTIRNASTDKISSLFIVSETELSDVVLEQYAKYARFEVNPINLNKDVPMPSVFWFYLNYPSDIDIKIYRSDGGLALFDEIKQRNLPPGVNSAVWSYDANRLQPGD